MKNSKLRWAVLGTGRFVTRVAIPAMRQCQQAQVIGIASRSARAAESAAEQLGLPKYYASYEAALQDPEVDVIYNALPNHLHVAWNIRAMQAGKHVLCEKPISLTLEGCRRLMEARDQAGVMIGEAFMIRHHRQWARALELAEGEVGQIRNVVGTFSYDNRNPADIRNQAACGGGALWDIGCYLVLVSRMAFRSEPLRVYAAMDVDPQFGVDRLTSAVLTFTNGHCIFSCGTQMAAFQNVQLIGTKGRVAVEIPFNAPVNGPCSLIIQRDGSPKGVFETETFRVNQYAAQADEFSAAVLGHGQPLTTLEDSAGTVRAIEALFESARSGVPVSI
jgi:predicted dehydrogenase